MKSGYVPMEGEGGRGHPGLNRGPLDLQSNALPLSYTPQPNLLLLSLSSPLTHLFYVTFTVAHLHYANGGVGHKSPHHATHCSHRGGLERCLE